MEKWSALTQIPVQIDETKSIEDNLRNYIKLPYKNQFSTPVVAQEPMVVEEAPKMMFDSTTTRLLLEEITSLREAEKDPEFFLFEKDVKRKLYKNLVVPETAKNKARAQRLLSKLEEFLEDPDFDSTVKTMKWHKLANEKNATRQPDDK